MKTIDNKTTENKPNVNTSVVGTMGFSATPRNTKYIPYETKSNVNASVIGAMGFSATPRETEYVAYEPPKEISKKVCDSEDN